MSEKRGQYFCSQLRQMLTDFHNYFTVGLKIELATKQLSLFPPHLKHVANIPCETTISQTFGY